MAKNQGGLQGSRLQESSNGKSFSVVMVSFMGQKMQFPWRKSMIGLVWVICPPFGCVCVCVCMELLSVDSPTNTMWNGGGVAKRAGGAFN